MRHLKKKKFGKGMDHRRKLLRTLGSSLLLYEKIQTTLQNGRAVKSYAEKVITTAKASTLHARRQLLAKLSPMAAKKAMEVLGPKYKERKGGYTRMTKLVSPKTGNSKVLIELV
ncbi:MAG: 50S ribosomal protein L17 [Candidatus Doudnabacteria bacterium]|nr:50S ribosomal protein L17 [Candidatus Doudnabacteria bacterium]